MNKRNPNHFQCNNCKHNWYDTPIIELTECPFCGSSTILILNKKIKNKNLKKQNNINS